MHSAKPWFTRNIETILYCATVKVPLQSFCYCVLAQCLHYPFHCAMPYAVHQAGLSLKSVLCQVFFGHECVQVSWIWSVSPRSKVLAHIFLVPPAKYAPTILALEQQRNYLTQTIAHVSLAIAVALLFLTFPRSVLCLEYQQLQCHFQDHWGVAVYCSTTYAPATVAQAASLPKQLYCCC
jgi:hypothetical protein